ISVADQQIENIRALVKTRGFNALAMSSPPVSLPGGFPSSSFNSVTHADPSSWTASATGCGSSNGGDLVAANYNDTTENQPKDPQNTSTSGVSPFSSCTNSSTQVGEPLEILSNGFVSPQQTNVSIGTDTAVVDTYVTDTYVGCNSTFSGCPTVTN